MSVPVPDWVSFEADKAGGIDLLGLRAPVQALGSVLFDGVTTVTPRLRYMSVISWIVWRYAQARLPEARSSFIDFAAGQECAFVLANRLNSRSVVQLVGSEAADVELDTKRKRLALKKLAKNLAYNIYIASSRQLNLTRPADSGLTKLSSQRGEALAKEFDKIVQNTAYGARLAKNPGLSHIMRGELEELAVPLAIGVIPRGERNILIDAVIPSTPVDVAEWRRLRQYSLLLWLVQRKERAIDEDDIFEVAQDPPQDLPRCLGGTVDGWLAYLVRDCLAVSHEAVFDALMRQVDRDQAIRNAPALADKVIEALVASSPGKGDVLREFKILRRNEPLESLSFQTVFERVGKLCSKGQTLTDGLARWSGGLSEVNLYRHARSSEDAAVSLLPIAWCLALQRSPKGTASSADQDNLSRVGGIFQIGIADVIRPKVEEFLEFDFTYQEVMSELVRRTAQQHLRVAWKRFSIPRGKDVSVLVADNEAWSRNNGFQPGRTASRLSVAIDWLAQLNLASQDGLTKRGRRTLERALALLESS